jgi:hypothetical protein
MPSPAQFVAQIAAYNEAIVEFATTESYRDGVRAYFNSLDAAGDATAVVRLEHFELTALGHGVDENTTP